MSKEPPVCKQSWLNNLSHKDWLFDGSPIHGKDMLDKWARLDWSRAWLDMGPSIAGNVGPYWHVPLKGPDGTTHRLYPKILKTKWLHLIRRAIEESVTRERMRFFDIR